MSATDWAGSKSHASNREERRSRLFIMVCSSRQVQVWICSVSSRQSQGKPLTLFFRWSNGQIGLTQFFLDPEQERLLEEAVAESRHKDLIVGSVQSQSRVLGYSP